MIKLLVSLHPKSWRDRYGAEFQALLEDGPLTFRVVMDVLINAVRQQIGAHPVVARLTAAIALSTVIEVVAVHTGLTDNILWAPTTPARAFGLLALIAVWTPGAIRVAAGIARRRSRRPAA